MLTMEENTLNFRAIKIYSILNIFPVKIDTKTGKIQRSSSKLKIFLWRILFCLLVSHSLFAWWRLVQSTILEPGKYFRWDHFILHVVFGPGYAIFYYTGFCLFEKNPQDCAIVFNQLFVQRENPVQKLGKEKEGEKRSWRKLGKRVSDEHKAQKIQNKSGSGIVRPLLAWPPLYSLDEIMARTFLFSCATTSFVTALVVALDQNRPQHLFSVLPPEYQNGYSFFGCLAIEQIFTTFVLAFAFFSNVSQLLFFSKCQLELKQLELQLRNLEGKFQSHPLEAQEIRRKIWILRETLKDMRELVLFIELFNRCFSPCIFALKLICLAVSIPFYFFTICHGQDFPFLAFFTGYIAITMTLIYGILYQKAFSIPQKMERLKREFLLAAHKTIRTRTTASISSSMPMTLPNSTERAALANERFRAEMTRGIWGIRDVGVKVGSFHTLERETTPRFIDFVLKNVVNLLVTFS